MCLSHALVFIFSHMSSSLALSPLMHNKWTRGETTSSHIHVLTPSTQKQFWCSHSPPRDHHFSEGRPTRIMGRGPVRRYRMQVPCDGKFRYTSVRAPQTYSVKGLEDEENVCELPWYKKSCPFLLPLSLRVKKVVCNICYDHYDYQKSVVIVEVEWYRYIEECGVHQWLFTFSPLLSTYMYSYTHSHSSTCSTSPSPTVKHRSYPGEGSGEERDLHSITGHNFLTNSLVGQLSLQ